jgi:hypothetical protein
MNTCSPNINISLHYTCFTYNELQIIAKTYNDYITNNTICKKSHCAIKKPINLIKKTKKQLWYSIYNRLKPICKYEYCWIDLKFIKKINDKNLRKKIMYFTFKPKMTSKDHTWLNTDNINQVMEQYEQLDKSFKFLGAQPSDFYKLINVNYNDVLKYKRIGIIFNLDNHKQPGSHWVAFYIDNLSKTLEYYDSGANLPNTNITVFINNFYKSLKKNGYKYTKHYNKIQHQFKNTECGVYSLHFLIQRLFGKTFHEICNNVIKDDLINKYRHHIFRPRK